MVLECGDDALPGRVERREVLCQRVTELREYESGERDADGEHEKADHGAYQTTQGTDDRVCAGLLTRAVSADVVFQDAPVSLIRRGIILGPAGMIRVPGHIPG
jgi:hypothetical protein